MDAVGSHVPLVSPVLGAEHHERKDSGKFHKPRPTRSERVKRGRQRDKARLQALRDQLADVSTSSASASDDSSQPGALTQRLNAALSRVSALEERIDHLLAIIAHLTATADDNSGQASQGATAEFFDLFRDHVANAETQTNISFDWSRPDVFVHLQDLERCASVSRASSHTCDAAHADAAAGVASAFTGLHSQFEVSKEDLADQGEPCTMPTTHNRLRNFTSVSQDASLSLDVDFNSQNLALHSEPLSDNQRQTDLPERTQCGPLPLDFSSQDLACLPDHTRQALDDNHPKHRVGNGVENQRQKDVGTWQALDDTNAKHQVHDMQTKPGPLPQDSNSQDLANSSVSELEVDNPSSGPSTTALSFGPSESVDFNSQNLASHSELLVENQRQQDVGTWQALDDPHAKHQVPEMQTKSGPSPQDSNSQDLANSSVSELEVDPSSGPSTTALSLGPSAHVDFNSTTQGGPAQLQSEALDVVTRALPPDLPVATAQHVRAYIKRFVASEFYLSASTNQRSTILLHTLEMILADSQQL